MHYLSADSQNKLNSAVKEFAANYATDVSPDLLEEMIQLRNLHRLKFGDVCLSPLDLLNMSGINESISESLHRVENLLLPSSYCCECRKILQQTQPHKKFHEDHNGTSPA